MVGDYISNRVCTYNLKPVQFCQLVWGGGVSEVYLHMCCYGGSGFQLAVMYKIVVYCTNMEVTLGKAF